MLKIISLTAIFLSSLGLLAQTSPNYSQKEITYDRRDGTSLTLTVLKPNHANGKGIVSLLSGNFVSNANSFEAYSNRALPLVAHGYTVFLVMHRSAPRFALPDMLEDIQRSVQFVRYHAADYQIDPAKIGITGTSSGGHLALLTALSKDIADPTSKDPLARVSTHLQAVAVFCPPTDLLNFGKIGYNLAQDQPTLIQYGLLGAFSYSRWDTLSHTYTPITELQQRRQIDSLMSPTQVVDKNAPPIFLMHGDKDPLVPLQQSQTLVAKLQKHNIPVQLVIKPGAAHGWKGMNEDEEAFNLWFDRYLK